MSSVYRICVVRVCWVCVGCCCVGDESLSKAYRIVSASDDSTSVACKEV